MTNGCMQRSGRGLHRQRETRRRASHARSMTARSGNALMRSVAERWLRLIGQKFAAVRWILAKVELSTAPLAAPCAGQERAARWVTRPSIYAAS